MRIIFATHHELNPDAGAAGATLGLAACLSEMGQDIGLLAYDDLPGRWPSPARDVVFPLYVAWALRSELRRPLLDVVDAACGDAWLWGTLRSGLGNVAPLLVGRIHGLEHLHHRELRAEQRRGGLSLNRRYRLYRGSIRLREVARSLRASDLVLCLNTAERDFVVDRLGVDRHRVAMTRTGLPPELLGVPLVGASHDERPLQLAMLGTWLPMKGVRYGVEAINRLLQRHSRLRLTCLGTGQSEDQVRRGFDEQVRPRVGVVDRYARKDLPELLTEHDLAVHPSLSEGLPTGVLECMACGLVPVAADNQGARELIEHDRNGILVPRASADELERAIAALLTDAPKRARLRQAAWETAQSFGWPAIASETLELYRAALQERGQRLPA